MNDEQIKYMVDRRKTLVGKPSPSVEEWAEWISTLRKPKKPSPSVEEWVEWISTLRKPKKWFVI